MDLFDRAYEDQQPALVRASGLYPYFHTLTGSEGPVVTIEGKMVVMLGSNNYLGLTHHPAVLEAAHEAIDQYGTGCTGSRLLNGNIELHDTLERELAAFTGKEAALVFSSGFLANFGVIATVGGVDGAVIFSEAENHASLIDGVRFARGAEVRVFEGLDDLERQLAAAPAWPHALVVTDAVFSMTGRVMDLRRVAALKRRYGFRLYVDDAHGFGVLGPSGMGTAASQGVQADVDLLFATFSKSLASLGGFVAGEAAVIEWLRHKARTLIFSAALPPASTAAALAALRVMQQDGARFVDLWHNVAYLREGFERLGYFTMGSTTPIIPLFVGSESLSFRMCREALDLGVFATPVVYPAMPYGQALIRTSVTPAHRRGHLDRAIEVFGELARRYPIPRVDPANLPVTDGHDFSYLFVEPESEATGT